MATDPPGRRVAAVLVTATGILVMSLLTAALTSKMGQRIAEMRGGLLPVVERDHVLVLGYAPNTPLLVRELARSGQRATIVVLATEDKERVELALRASRQVRGQRLHTIVRTGEPRYELALVRVAAERARAIVVIPPAATNDDESVRWTLAVLLALHRVLPDDWRGRVLVEARHEEARELLSLAVERDVAGAGVVPTRVVATDRVVARILAQSVRQDGLYFVIRHLLAFDGCELYFEAVPEDLIGEGFDLAHARMQGAVLLGVVRTGRPVLCPAPASLILERRDRLIVVADGPRRHRWDGRLPAPPSDTSAPPPTAGPERVVVLGHNVTLPHLLEELTVSLAPASRIDVLTDDDDEAVAATVARAAARSDRVTIAHTRESPTALARLSSDKLCAADALVVLGEEGTDDVNGDASALAMLLRLRRALRDFQRASPAVPVARVVTEVRDPRSAVHVEPRPGDAIVSSDVVAMLLAQGVLEPDAFPVYDALLAAEGARIWLRPRAVYVGSRAASFADVMAAARARGEIALGFYPDPRPHPSRARLDRQRLEEGDTSLGEEAWLNPPRGTDVPDDASSRVVVVAAASSAATLPVSSRASEDGTV